MRYNLENEQEINTPNSSNCFSTLYMDLDLSPPHHDQQQMPDSRVLCDGHVTTSAFPLLPQQEQEQEGTLLDLAWLHYDLLESKKGSGEDDGGLLFGMGLDEEHDHDLAGGGMDDNFGASSGVVVQSGNNNNNNAQAFF